MNPTIKPHLFVLSLLLLAACKNQLDIKNPNDPTPIAAYSEQGILSFAQGAVYASGFRDLKYTDGVPGAFWSGVVGFHEIMGDALGVEAANQYLNQIGAPETVTLDNGTRVANPNAPNTQKALLRLVNTNANAGSNPLYYEWAYMYAMNNACNVTLEVVDSVKFSGNAAAKKATVQAWAYWWKGFAYSRIGSIYYAGLVVNKTGIAKGDLAGVTNGNYVTKEAILQEADANFNKAIALLTPLMNNADYKATLTTIIPSMGQTGKGMPLSSDMWLRVINTHKARNILANTPVATMTSAQWGTILTLTNAGIRAGDNVFTGRANENGDFVSATGGSVAAKTTGDPGDGATYKVSERLIQDFKTGDKRLENNFEQLADPWIGNSDRGNAFNTRWALLDGGNKIPGVVTLSSRTPGEYELFLSATYEENDLMKAEALINTGNLEGGLALIDAVRSSQGAGLAAVAGTGLDAAAAKEELRRERRVALVFRGLAFYDARRLGIIRDVSAGGGRKGAVVIDGKGVISTNATINYNYLDYWDVPDNELVYNKPAAGSAPVKNPAQ